MTTWASRRIRGSKTPRTCLWRLSNRL